MKRTLIVCQGIPASGKTTWALGERAKRKICDVCLRHYTGPDENRTLLDLDHVSCPHAMVIRVNQDDIRKELGWTSWDTWDFEGALEKRVHELKEEKIRAAFEGGADTVISDDTNLSRKAKETLAKLALEYGAELVVKRFDTPLDECIRRDALREHPVGEKVIRDFYQRTLKEDPATQTRFGPYMVPRVWESPAIICDLDGTLSLFKGRRSPYDASKCAEDTCNSVVRNILEVHYRFLDWQIIYLSGRFEKFRPETDEFMRRHHCPPGQLYMRPDGDYRTDWIVKGEFFDKWIRNRFDVRFVLDDRDQVVKFWRSIGLTCLQVAEGNF